MGKSSSNFAGNNVLQFGLTNFCWSGHCHSVVIAYARRIDSVQGMENYWLIKAARCWNMFWDVVIS